VSDRPLVGIVVVDYNGGDRTVACVERLHQLTWPADRLRIVLVDNASTNGAAAGTVTQRWPDVDVVRSPVNLGFGGGCNLGFDRLRDATYVALVNNDALPEPDWLEPLVAALDDDARLGAATPKVLLAEEYARCTITTDEATAPTHRDPRRLGVQVSGIEVDGADVLDDALARSGVWGWEHDAVTVGGRFRWTADRAELLVPVRSGARRIALRLACGLGARRAKVDVGGGTAPTVEVDVGVQPAWVTLDAPPPGERERLVNNAGLVLLDDGQLADRGYLEPDGPPYDEPADVFGWSGACVLLRRAYVDDVGGFDARLFLYYEDGDLSWRGRLRGWRYRYVPDAVVHHERSASVGNVSPLVRHLARRNQLIVLAKDAPARLAWRAVAKLAADLAGAAWRDVVLAPFASRRPSAAHVVDLARVLGGFTRHLPTTLAQRRRIQRGRLGAR
jgi:GT2 family glycosyltransferase